MSYATWNGEAVYCPICGAKGIKSRLHVFVSSLGLHCKNGHKMHMEFIAKILNPDRWKNEDEI